MTGDLPDSAPAPAAEDKVEGKSVPVSVMLIERKAKQAAVEERDRAMETTRKQSDRIKSQQTQIEELNGTILSLEARVQELQGDHERNHARYPAEHGTARSLMRGMVRHATLA